jgi:hypothetical protein
MRAKNDSAIYRPDLGMTVMEYAEGNTMGFIGLEIMPIFRTGLSSASYPVIPKEALLSVPDTARAPRGRYNRGDWDYERGYFTTSEHGWEEPVDDSERALIEQEGSEGIGDFIATKRAWNHIMRSQEKRIAAKLFNASNFTAHSVSDEWDDATNATPITDVNDGRSAFRLQCGMLPDALVISWNTFQDLKECDQIVNRLKYTFPGIDINKMTSDQLAAVFDVPRVLIGGSIYNSNGKGLDASVSDIWDDEYAALVKISASPDITDPGVGRTFLWTEDSPQNPIVEQYREDNSRSDIFRVRHNTDEAFLQSKDDSGTVKSNIAAACVYLFDNITS